MHGELALLVDLLSRGVAIDQGTKRDCRRLLQCLGWDPADFCQRTLPEKQLCIDVITRRLQLYGWPHQQVKSEDSSAYCDTERGQRMARECLHVLTNNPKLWFAEPGDDDIRSPIDEEPVSSKEFASRAEHGLHKAGSLKQDQLPMDASEATGGSSEDVEASSIMDDNPSHSNRAAEGVGKHSSSPIQFHMISSPRKRRAKRV